LIPSHNHARYVGTCLDSVAQQNYPVLEVVLIDDGSTDDTFETVMAWKESHPRRSFELHCTRQVRQGIPVTANRLVRAARGDILIPLASDDLILPDGIHLRVDALQRHPDWWGVFGDCVVIDGDGQRLWESGLSDVYHADKEALADDSLRRMELILNWCVPGPVFAVRRFAYDPEVGVGPYDESLLLEDRDFFLRLLAMQRLGFLDHQVAAYRWHSGNSFHSNTLGGAERLRALATAELRFASDPRLQWSERAALRALGGLKELEARRIESGKPPNRWKQWFYRKTLRHCRQRHRGKLVTIRDRQEAS
jgi:glycosyltransferase involved in cell wall biosynthesis